MAEQGDSRGVLVWIRNRRCLAQSIRNITIRVRHPSKFGENVRGVADMEGSLATVSWGNVLRIRPSSLLLANSNCPVRELIKALSDCSEHEVREFLSRLRVLSVHSADVTVEEVSWLLSRCPLLSAFSFYDITWSDEQLKKLSTVELRGLDACCGDPDTLLGGLHVELLRIAGSPGFTAKQFQKLSTCFADKIAPRSKVPLVTVRALAVLELNYLGSDDAEVFLSSVVRCFPRLESLLFDWTVVDPVITNETRTDNIVEQLIRIYSELKLGAFVMIAYTPCADTSAAVENVTRKFQAGGLVGCEITRFASRGLSGGKLNFSVVHAGSNLEARHTIVKALAEDRNSIPSIGDLLPLLDASLSKPFPSVQHDYELLVDFGGFNSELIKKEFASKSWNTSI